MYLTCNEQLRYIKCFLILYIIIGTDPDKNSSVSMVTSDFGQTFIEIIKYINIKQISSFCILFQKLLDTFGSLLTPASELNVKM